MGVDEIIYEIPIIVGFIPLVFLSIADLQFRIYKRKLILEKSELVPSEFPLLVKYHSWIIHSLAIHFLVAILSLSFMFGLPLLVTFILWPEYLPTALSEFSWWMIIFSFMMFLRVICLSPDPYGGFEDLLKQAEDIEEK